MTIKEFFQNLGQGISQGWANLRNRFSSANDEAANPLFEEPIEVSDEVYEQPQQPRSSTSLMTETLISDPASAVMQPESSHDFDAQPTNEGIQEYNPTLGERASHFFGSVTSLFKRKECGGSRLMNDWLDSSSYTSVDDDNVVENSPSGLKPL